MCRRIPNIVKLLPSPLQEVNNYEEIFDVLDVLPNIVKCSTSQPTHAMTLLPCTFEDMYHKNVSKQSVALRSMLYSFIDLVRDAQETKASGQIIASLSDSYVRGGLAKEAGKSVKREELGEPPP